MKSKYSIVKAWRKRNPKRLRAQESRYRKKHPEAARRKYIQWRYGITERQYQDLFNAQNGKCAICRCPYAVLCIDHDHATGKVRGLLCKSCNFLLGMAKDLPSLLRRAAEYLTQNQNTKTKKHHV